MNKVIKSDFLFVIVMSFDIELANQKSLIGYAIDSLKVLELFFIRFILPYHATLVYFQVGTDQKFNFYQKGFSNFLNIGQASEVEKKTFIICVACIL